MITILRTKFYKLIVLSIVSIAFLFSYSMANLAFSQSPSPSAGSSQASDIKYPIEELGKCKDEASCINYCNDPVNQNSCIDFAKKNGFYKDDISLYADDKFWKDAKSELGCDSEESCSKFCTDSKNFEACSNFAKRNEIPGGYTKDPEKPEFLETAKEVLGCDSEESCSKFCDDPNNVTKCTEFADKTGLLGGTQQGGPNGCQTPETCTAYCSDPANFGACSPFAPGGGTFSGPGGCNSEESCRSYCDKNPSECRSYAPGTSGAYVPMTCSAEAGIVGAPGGVCTRLSDYSAAVSCIGADKYWDGKNCQDKPPVGIDPEFSNANFEERPEMGNCKTPGECYDYCKENPGKCPNFDANSPRPTDEYSPYLYYTPGSEVTHAPVESMGGCTSPAGCYDYCKENLGKCEGFNSKSPRPPEVYIPGTYYTPPSDVAYATPPLTNFYTTPIYYTPPQGSTYTTPQYYTPGTYYTPSYQTPPTGSNYVTPNYYSPYSNYTTPSGQYPTPSYSTPSYYTPPIGSNYTTPYYYTPPTYTTPYYFTPSGNYTTPSYSTPPPYSTPQYYTPFNVGTYTTPVYFTPPVYQTPTYYTPPPGSNYTSPSYYTPPQAYTTPKYYTPGTYPTPVAYSTPPSYASPSYFTPPPGSNYTSPTYYSPTAYTTPTYYTPPTYVTPSYFTPYTSPSYSSPPTGSTYTSPTYYTPYNTPSGTTTSSYPTPSYSYPSPGTYTSPDSYPSPVSPGYSYPTPGYYYTPSNYSYPSPSSGSYSYPSPSTGYSYPTPSYSTPSSSYSYPSPSYGTPSYGTPSYGTPSYETPSYAYPSPVQGVTSKQNILQRVWYSITSLFGR